MIQLRLIASAIALAACMNFSIESFASSIHSEIHSGIDSDIHSDTKTKSDTKSDTQNSTKNMKSMSMSMSTKDTTIDSASAATPLVANSSASDKRSDVDTALLKDCLLGVRKEMRILRSRVAKACKDASSQACDLAKTEVEASHPILHDKMKSCVKAGPSKPSVARIGQ